MSMKDSSDYWYNNWVIQYGRSKALAEKLEASEEKVAILERKLEERREAEWTLLRGWLADTKN